MIRYKTILSFLLQPIRRAISRAISRRDWSLIFLDLIHGITASYSRGFEEAIKKFFSWWVPAFFKPDDNDLDDESCYDQNQLYYCGESQSRWPVIVDSKRCSKTTHGKFTKHALGVFAFLDFTILQVKHFFIHLSFYFATDVEYFNGALSPVVQTRCSWTR